MTIVSNQVKCKTCGDTPWSGSVHDYRSCKCGAVAVDGGCDYLRRVGNVPNGYEEMSIELPESMVQNLINAVKWADETGRNERGVAYAVLRAIRDSGYTILEKS